MKKIFFILFLVVIFLSPQYLLFAEKGCCDKSTCQCIKGSCCNEGECSCAGGCCSDGQCNCSDAKRCSSQCSCS